MNGLNKRRKATFVSTLINNYGACWVKNIKDNVICLSKQQIKHAVAYLLVNYYFTVGPKILSDYWYSYGV